MFAMKSILPNYGPAKSRHRKSSFSGLLLHLTALLLFVVFFVGTMLVFFPNAQLRDHLENLIQRQTGERITIGELSFSPLLRLQAESVAWQPTVGNWPLMVIDRLSLSPVWVSLFSGNPVGRFNAAIAGGTIYGRGSGDGSFEVELSDISITPFQATDFLFPTSGTIGGRINAERLSDSKAEAADFDLQFNDLRISGLKTIGLPEAGLTLGNLKLKGYMTGQTMKIAELHNEQGDLFLSSSGTVLIGNSPQQCRLNLQIEVKPGPSLGPALDDLLMLGGLKANAAGSYRFHLAGTLASPILR